MSVSPKRERNTIYSRSRSVSGLFFMFLSANFVVKNLRPPLDENAEKRYDRKGANAAARFPSPNSVLIGFSMQRF